MAKSPWRSVFDFITLLKTSVSKDVTFLRYILWSVQNMLTLRTSFTPQQYFYENTFLLMTRDHFSMPGEEHPFLPQILPHFHPQKLAPAGKQPSTAHAPRGTSSQLQIQLLQAASVPASMCGCATSLRAPSH